MITKEKIQRVLNMEKHYRETLPRINYFGEDNWQRHDMAIRLLEDALADRKSDWFDKWYYIDHNDEVDFRHVTDIADWLDGTFDDEMYDEALEEEGF